MITRGEAEPVLVYDDVTYAYPVPPGQVKRNAIEHVSLVVTRGHRLGILGANGGGKTTLLKLTVGLLKGHRGSIRVCGRDPDEAVRGGLIGYVAQRNEAELAFPLTARQVASMSVDRRLRPWQRRTAEMNRRVDEALELVGGADLADRVIGKLSGGQLQRVMIARALACRPEILLLDEPMSGLDVTGQQRFAAMLERVRSETGVTLVVVSHDIRAIAASCDSIACLNRTLHCHTTPEGLTPQVLAEVFQHEVAAVFGDVHVHAHDASACPDPGHEHAKVKDAGT